MQHHSHQLLQQLKQCCSIQLPIQTQKLHAHVIKSGLHLHGPLYPNTIIHAYGKYGNLKYALQLFDEMSQRDLASWASIFTAHNQANLPKQTLFLFTTMDGFVPDHFIFASLVKACASLPDLRLGLQLHAQFVVSSFSNDDVVKSSLVDFYAKCGFPDRGRRVFDSIVCKNVVSWTSLVYGFAKIGRKSEALGVFRDMPCKNLHTWTALISGFVQGGKCIESFKVFSEARKEGVDIQEPFILSSLIAGSASLTMVELGKQVHRLVIGVGYEYNSYVSNTLIDMYAKCSDVCSAEKVFMNMINRDVVSWTSMIVGMAQHGRGYEALSLYNEMTLEGLKPNEVTFTGLIYACSHVGLVEKGKQLFESMVMEYGLTPSIQHYTCLVDLYSRSGKIEEAENIITMMPFKADETTWAALLSACIQNGKNEAGIRIANHLLQLGIEDSSTCILMSNIYARASMWKSVSNVRKLMMAMDLEKKPGYSCVELGKENEVFYAGEPSHPMRDQIFGLLKELDCEMRKKGLRA